MAGWHSLSGYLYYKPGGALGKFKSKRRQWYLFDESGCQLIWYKSQEDSGSKSPLGSIEIGGSSISLNLDQNNQFVITSKGKEHMFIADNHESMMIWLLGLQAKRDAYAHKKTPSTKETGSTRRRGSEPAVSHAYASMPDATLSRGGSFRIHSHSSRPPLLAEEGTPPRPRLKKSDTISESMNPTAAFENGQKIYDMTIPLSKSFSPGLLEDITASASSPESRRTGSILERSSSGGLNESEEDDIGEVFDYDLLAAKDEEVKTSTPRHSERTESRASISNLDAHERTSSWSGQSSDSAIDRGEPTTMNDLHLRLSDMEKDLMNTKCELAKVLNREACIKQVLEKRDMAIQELDDKLERLEHLEFTQEGNNNLSAAAYAKKLKEQCRVLQNQNRFLNEEVKKLTRIRQMEISKFTEQEDRNRHLDAMIEKWKRDYLSVLQSCISVPSGDILDGMEVNLYGGNRHKDRIQYLLDEAKKTNPCLPTFERLSLGETHVDTLGFKHSFDNEGLMLHYICTQLHEHYVSLLTSHEEHQIRWKEYLAEHKNNLQKSKELKSMCRAGIPPQHRGEVWKQLVANQVSDIMAEKGQHYYSNLVNNISDSQFAGRYRKQISLDLLRTMPTNVHFDCHDSDGIQKMQEVLQAYCVHSTTLGYCQGMNFISAMSLLYMEKEDSFWTLAAMTEKYFTPHYFDHNLIGAQADQEVLKELLHEKLPKLHRHLDDLDIEISTVTLNWFLAIFFDSVPMETLLRIWDCFLLEGPKVLFRFALAILKIHEKALLDKEDTISIMKHLKLCARLTFDSDGLIKVAFEDLKPFPRRRDIASKQTVYLKMLKEQVRKREEERRHLAEREEMFRELELTPQNALIIECATAYQEGKIWMCHGEQNSGKICKINCDENIMHDLNCEFDSRIMCITSVTDDLVLLGTLSWTLYAFSTITRDQLWNTRLHDAILGLCCHHEEGEKNKIFAALADGTIAIMEDISEDIPKSDVFYILIGHSPVTSLLLINHQLWCASGNSVVILHASTLDTMDSFAVSNTPFDHIHSLMRGDNGIWIAVKGSSTLELWDTNQLVCRLLYDVRENRYYMSRRDEENFFNPSRITAILPYKNYLWVGTARGDLIIYEISEKLVSKQTAVSSSDVSVTTSCTTSLSSSPYTSNRGEFISKITPMESVEEKVRELYFQRMHVEQDENASNDHDQPGEEEEEIENPSDTEHLHHRALSPRSSQDTDSTFTDNTSKTVCRHGSGGSDSGVAMSKTKVVTVKSDPGMKVLEAEVTSQDSTKEGVHLQIFVQVQAGGKEANPQTDKCVGTDSNSDEESESGKMSIPTVVVEESGSSVPEPKGAVEVRESDEDEFVDCSDGDSSRNSPMRALKRKGGAGEVSVETGGHKGEERRADGDTVGKISDISADPTEGKSDQKIDERDNEKSPEEKIDKISSEIDNEDQSYEKVNADDSRPTEDNLSETDNPEKTSCRIRKESADSGTLTAEDNLSDEVFQDEKPKARTERVNPSHGLSPEDPQSQRPLSPIMERLENTSTCTNTNSNPDSAEQLKSGVSTPNKFVSGRNDSSPKPSIDGNSKPQMRPELALGDSMETDKNSALWSSYEDMSSNRDYDSHSVPSEAKDVINPLLLGPQWGRKDRRPSLGVVSACSDFPYAYEMALLVKMKISDKPIKCLLHTRSNDEDVIISCAGCYSDDEPVLKWRKEPNEKLWTNEPIFEICQLTNTPKPPSYMRHRLSLSSASQRSGDTNSTPSVSSPRMSLS